LVFIVSTCLKGRAAPAHFYGITTRLAPSYRDPIIRQKVIGLLIVHSLEGTVFADLSARATAGRESTASNGRFQIRKRTQRFVNALPHARGAVEPAPATAGQGYGSRLAHGVFEALRRDGKRVIAKCPFMSSYAPPTPKYGALLDG
jgi:GCN5-related N-acetyl-transferase